MKPGSNLPHEACFGSPHPLLEMGREMICVCKQVMWCLSGVSILREPIQNFLRLTLVRITACHHVWQ